MTSNVPPGQHRRTCPKASRFRPRDNGRFVRIAIGSLGETINHLGHARKQGYMPEDEWAELVVLAKRARGASTAWLAYLDSCPRDGPKKKQNPEPPKP
jgi:hypothetical protein